MRQIRVVFLGVCYHGAFSHDQKSYVKTTLINFIKKIHIKQQVKDNIIFNCSVWHGVCDIYISAYNTLVQVCSRSFIFNTG